MARIFIFLNKVCSFSYKWIFIIILNIKLPSVFFLRTLEHIHSLPHSGSFVIWEHSSCFPVFFYGHIRHLQNFPSEQCSLYDMSLLNVAWSRIPINFFQRWHFSLLTTCQLSLFFLEDVHPSYILIRCPQIVCLLFSSWWNVLAFFIQILLGLQQILNSFVVDFLSLRISIFYIIFWDYFYS